MSEEIVPGDTIYANCSDPRCFASTRLDLQALGQRHGASHDDLTPLLRCERCKAEGRPQRRPFLTCVPDYTGSQTRKHAAGFGLPKRRSKQIQEQRRVQQAQSEGDHEHDSDAESDTNMPISPTSPIRANVVTLTTKNRSLIAGCADMNAGAGGGKRPLDQLRLTRSRSRCRSPAAAEAG